MTHRPGCPDGAGPRPPPTRARTAVQLQAADLRAPGPAVARVHERAVAAGPAVHAVHAVEGRVQVVVPGPAEQRVAAEAAVELVVARAAAQRVGAAAALDLVVAGAAVHLVVAEAAEDPVVPGA